MTTVVLMGLAGAGAGVPTLPPSTSLKGELGTLRWEVKTTPKGLTLDGRSPRWKVHHEAGPGLEPRFTRREDAKGRVVTLRYDATGAVYEADGKKTRIDEAGLWDADTVDIRLGRAIAAGKKSLEFRAIDTDSGTVYTFAASREGAAFCGPKAHALACTEVSLHLTGLYRWVGPSWKYWFGPDGRLLKFKAKWGSFETLAQPEPRKAAVVPEPAPAREPPPPEQNTTAGEVSP